MRNHVPTLLAASRYTSDYFPPAPGLMGAFLVPSPTVAGDTLRIISSGLGQPWEHVSVSLTYRTPFWSEMCYVKDLFWDDEECVIQFHPPRSEYVNNNPNVLHLWKPPYPVPTPPINLV